jgi:hypothetical protein
MSDAIVLPRIDPGTHIGVTGTRWGGTPDAVLALKFLIDQLQALGATWLHQGCCKGWDEQSVIQARKAGLRIAAHPPVDNSQFSQIAFNASCLRWPPKSYRDRNEDIAFETAVLIAGPQFPELDERSERSGTWQTVRLARKYGTPVYSCDSEGNITDVSEAPDDRT